EAAFFRRDTWHHGRAWGSAPLRVLELMAPTPAAGASTAYALRQPYLDLADARTADDALLGRLPMDAPAIAAAASFRVLRDADRTCRLEGDLLVGLLVSTPELSAAIAELPAHGRSELRRYGGDLLLHGLSGSVEAELPEPAGERIRVGPGDTLVVPAGFPVHLHGDGRGDARLLLGAAPGYLPAAGGEPPR
ncbi:MAG: hypothetical protein ACKOTZ_06500, partial [Chloroflexota bacterium]